MCTYAVQLNGRDAFVRSDATVSLQRVHSAAPADAHVPRVRCCITASPTASAAVLTSGVGAFAAAIFFPTAPPQKAAHSAAGLFFSSGGNILACLFQKGWLACYRILLFFSAKPGGKACRGHQLGGPCSAGPWLASRAEAAGARARRVSTPRGWRALGGRRRPSCAGGAACRAPRAVSAVARPAGARAQAASERAAALGRVGGWPEQLRRARRRPERRCALRGAWCAVCLCRLRACACAAGCRVLPGAGRGVRGAGCRVRHCGVQSAVQSADRLADGRRPC